MGGELDFRGQPDSFRPNFGNSKCCLMRLKITLERGIRQQEDILSPCHPISTRINRVARTVVERYPILLMALCSCSVKTFVTS